MSQGKCFCIVHHPDMQSQEWQNALRNLRDCLSLGRGNVVPLLVEQLFGECPDRKVKVNG